MFRPALVPIILSCAAGLSGCGKAPVPAPSAASTPATASVPIQEVMAKSFTPQSNLIWERSGRLYGDDGNLDAALLTAEDWSTLRQAASDMRSAALTLQTATPRTVVAAGVKIQGEGGPGALSPAQIQALIDAAPEAFAAEAGKLVQTSDAFLVAIDSRDAKALDDLSGQLNEVCSSCHMRFWYPDQPAQ